MCGRGNGVGGAAVKLDHLSFSQWKAWTSCPAAAHAQYVRREYRPGTTEAMALGALTELAMTVQGTPEALIAQLELAHAACLCTLKGVPTKDAARAVEWGRQAAELPDVRAAMDGARLQAALTCSLGGVPWHCRLDVWDPDCGLVWDIKTCASPLAEEYVPRLSCRGNFIAANRYGYQLALYAEAVRQETDTMPGVGIIAIGKHKTRSGQALPDVWLFEWTDAMQLTSYRDALTASCLYPWTCDLGECIAPIPELYELDGDGLPRCETCDWCIISRVNRVRPYADPNRRS
jgi:hypothetical protein